MERMVVEEDLEIGKTMPVSETSEIEDNYSDTLSELEFETDVKGKRQTIYLATKISSHGEW